VFCLGARVLKPGGESRLLLDLLVTVPALNITSITEFTRNLAPALLAARGHEFDQPSVLLG
jgi:hypothetical protein